MKKNIYFWLFSFIFTINFLIPFFATAATPTLNLSLFSENQNSQTGMWSWNIVAETTDIPNNTSISFSLYEIKIVNGKTVSTKIHQETEQVQNNQASYLTGSILYSNTAHRVTAIILPSTSKSFSKITPVGITPDIIIQGDGDITIGGGTEQIEPPIQPISPQTDNTSNNSSSDTYKLLAPIPGMEEAANADSIGKYFNTIFLIAIGLCGVLAVIMIVIGGIQYMGDESIFGKTEAKGRITKAILGLIIALGAFALLNTINPELLGGGGLNIRQVSAEIIDLPDAGDGTVDPDFKKGGGTYSTDAVVSPEVTNVVSKIKQGWEINQFKVYTNNRMLISIKKGTEIDNTNIINIKPGINGYAPTGTARVGDKKTPIGSWKILSIKTSKDGQPVYSKSGANMGASFWLLSPMTSGERGIGMHGNKNGTLSGTFGCIRLKNSDLLALLPYVKPGIIVNVVN